jgi:hypothetical protein
VTAAEEAMLASLGLTEQLDFRRLSTKAACGIGAPETGSAGVESYAPFTAEQPAG